MNNVSNQVAILGLFLVGITDKIISFFGCPGLSYLNATEREMSLINLGFTNSAPSIDPYAEEGIMDEVLSGT